MLGGDTTKPWKEETEQATWPEGVMPGFEREVEREVEVVPVPVPEGSVPGQTGREVRPHGQGLAKQPFGNGWVEALSEPSPGQSTMFDEEEVDELISSIGRSPSTSTESESDIRL